MDVFYGSATNIGFFREHVDNTIIFRYKWFLHSLV